MKSIIVLYDDLCEIDRTEATYQDEPQLKTIIRSLIADQPDTQLAEVYAKSSGSLIVSYTITPKGKLIEKERTKRRPGGYHPGIENNLPHHPAVFKENITIPLRPEIKAALAPLGIRRAAYIRKAIEEKMEREGNPIPKPKEKPKPPEGHPDRRYHQLIKNLPPSIKTYKGNIKCRSSLTISRTDTAWRVSYGPYTPEIHDSPSIQNKDLLSALEWLSEWLVTHNRKWVVGKEVHSSQK